MSKKKFGLQHQLRSENEYLRAQLRAYQLIVAECLAVVHDVPLEQAADFIPPPVELRTDFSDEEIRRRVQEWWERRVAAHDRHSFARSNLEVFAQAIYQAKSRERGLDGDNGVPPPSSWDRLLEYERTFYRRIAERYLAEMPRET